MEGDIHIHNARIWTGLERAAWAERITIRGGSILSVGEEAPARAWVVDAGGMTVLPGLIDSHIHLMMGGKALGELDLTQVKSREEFEAAIAKRHGELKDEEWLVGRGWSQANWAGGKMPSKEWLRSTGERPVVCYRMDFHAGVVNDAVLKKVDVQTEVIGGRFERDEKGALTGLLFEAALWERVNPVLPDGDWEAKRKWLRRGMRHANRLGITAVGAMEYEKDIRNTYLPMRNELTVRCKCMVMDRAWPMKFDFGQTFANDDRLGVFGYKAFADGTMGSRTARMMAEYSDDAGNRGMLVELAAKGHLRKWAQGSAKAGMSPCIHAIGDEGARVALEAIEGIHPEMRARIEHAQQLAEEDISKFREVIASMQPLHKADDGRYVEQRVGADRLGGTFVFRTLKRAGARLAFGSDWPVVSCDPMLGIRAAVTGLTMDGRVFKPEENLTVEEALRAYTVDAAYAIHLDRGGVLAAGALADLVLVDRNPFEIDWMQEMPRVTATMVDGEFVYESQNETG